MRREVFFSVCIPNFNYARYLGETLRSVLAQDFPHFEVIVADNASTDDSVAVVEALANSRVRLIRNPVNFGFAANLDRATEAASGNHLLLLSSDDLMRPGALTEYSRILESLGERASRAVLTSALDLVDAEGRLVGVQYRPRGELFYTRSNSVSEETEGSEGLTMTPGLKALRESLLRKDSPAAFLATCYSRELYEAVGGYRSSYRVFPDSHFLNKLLAEDALLVYVPKRLFAYREHGENQLAVEAGQGALKYQVDAYLHSIEIPEEVLRRIDLRREDLVRVFVDRAVIDRGLQSLAAGQSVKGFRLLAFAIATYPGVAIKMVKSWALAFLVAIGPIGTWMARGLYARRVRRRAPRP